MCTPINSVLFVNNDVIVGHWCAKRNSTPALPVVNVALTWQAIRRLRFHLLTKLQYNSEEAQKALRSAFVNV